MNLINNCKCGKLATTLVIIQRTSFSFCDKHVAQLEQFLGEKLEPLTTQYESRI